MSEVATVRETKEVTIEGHKLVVLTYITGREQRSVQVNLLDKLEISGGASKELSGLKGSMMLDQRDEYVKIIIKSVDGKSENTLEEILNLPSKESEAIFQYVSNIVEGKETASN